MRGALHVVQAARLCIESCPATNVPCRALELCSSHADMNAARREELDECAKDERCEVHYMLSKPPDNWTGGKGRCCQATFEAHLFPAADDCLALICGPPAMQVRTDACACTGNVLAASCEPAISSRLAIAHAMP